PARAESHPLSLHDALPICAASGAPTDSEAPAADSSGAPAAAAAHPPKDPSELAGHLGYLYVSSPIDTQVFVQGKAAGQTNSYLRSEEHTSELQSRENLVCR